MQLLSTQPPATPVALRKESVDRNAYVSYKPYNDGVALRKESVDRNVLMSSCMIGPPCRSPQGERG